MFPTNSSFIFSVDNLTLIAGFLLLLSVVSSKLSSRFGIPSLLFFILVGMAAGSEGVLGIYFDNYPFAHGFGILALVLILFGGGLDTPWNEIRPVILPGISLATIGVAVTAGMIGLLAHYLLGLTWLQAMLLGAVVSSTDAAAVFGVLRAQGLRLKGNLAALLELESGSNDPAAVFLTMGITGLILDQSKSVWHLVPDLVVEMGLGVAGGVIIGRCAGWMINRVHLDFDGLYNVLTVAIALIAYAGVQSIGGNGFLSVYLCGLTLGRRNFVHRISLIQFHEGLSWLMQIAMFLCLGLLIFPSRLLEQAGTDLLFAFFLVFVARPLAVFVSLIPFKKLTLNDKAFISWVGLRGAVPIILATIPLTAGVPGAQLIFNEVFFIVLVSVLAQGMSIRWVAEKLGVLCPEGRHINEKRVSSSVMEVTIPEGSSVVGMSVVELNLPPATLLVMLSRNGESSIPRGATVLQARDVLLVQALGESVEQVKKIFAHR